MKFLLTSDRLRNDALAKGRNEERDEKVQDHMKNPKQEPKQY